MDFDASFNPDYMLLDVSTVYPTPETTYWHYHGAIEELGMTDSIGNSSWITGRKPVFEKKERYLNNFPNNHYHLIGPSHRHINHKKTQHRFSTWAFILRASHESEKLLRAWIAHDGGVCWVEQGAFWFEVAKFVSEFNRGSRAGNEAKFVLNECENKMRSGGAKSKPRCQQEEYRNHTCCVHPETKRSCTAEPASWYNSTMDWDCGIMVRCAEAVWSRGSDVTGDDFGFQRPPVALWTRGGDIPFPSLSRLILHKRK
mmetsp:Transcript_11317/g.14737  ORF Transcript_11317/g.14737 Transcript_11317/m.14737 type:complete len:257 (+) Transcript_11317:3-773(+)